MSRAGDAAGLLVADEVQDDSAVAEQCELARRQGAVEHADEAALHVGRAAPADPAVPPPGAKLIRILRRDDIEVPVEVDRARAVADRAAHDARVLELAERGDLDQLGRQPEAPHRRVQGTSAPAELAPRRFSVSIATSSPSRPAIASALGSSHACASAAGSISGFPARARSIAGSPRGRAAGVPAASRRGSVTAARTPRGGGSSP